MDHLWTLLIALAGGVVGAGLTYLTASQQLRLRRRMEATESFLRICSHAHGYPADRSQDVGLAEQMAAISLLAGLGNDFAFLREPARAAFQCMAEKYAGSDGFHSGDIAAAARTAEASLKAPRGGGVVPGYRERPKAPPM